MSNNVQVAFGTDANANDVGSLSWYIRLSSTGVPQAAVSNGNGASLFAGVAGFRAFCA